MILSIIRSTQLPMTSRLCFEMSCQAVLRTAEAFGIQHVWTLEPPPMLIKNTGVCRKIHKGSTNWLSLRTFSRLDELIKALKEDGREIWAADVAKDSEELTAAGPQLPPKLALVIGREADGVSPAMLKSCDRKVYLPMHGFTESFNLSVATALLLQRLFDICPAARGDMAETERRQLRLQWFEHLVRSNPSKYKDDPRRAHQSPSSNPRRPLRLPPAVSPPNLSFRPRGSPSPGRGGAPLSTAPLASAAAGGGFRVPSAARGGGGRRLLWGADSGRRLLLRLLGAG